MRDRGDEKIGGLRLYRNGLDPVLAAGGYEILQLLEKRLIASRKHQLSL